MTGAVVCCAAEGELLVSSDPLPLALFDVLGLLLTVVDEDSSGSVEADADAERGWLPGGALFVMPLPLLPLMVLLPGDAAGEALPCWAVAF